jgi:hypothetical protein
MITRELRIAELRRELPKDARPGACVIGCAARS